MTDDDLEEKPTIRVYNKSSLRSSFMKKFAKYFSSELANLSSEVSLNND